MTNPLIPLMAKGVDIMTPFELEKGRQELASGKQKLATDEIDLKSKDITNESEKIKLAVTRAAYVAKNIQSFVDKPYTPELDFQWRQTKKNIEATIGHAMPNLPDKYEPDVIKQNYTIGIDTTDKLAKRYQQINTVEHGLGKFDEFTGETSFPDKPVHAPSASPDLQAEIQRSKEGWKVGKATGPQGEELSGPNRNLYPEYANTHPVNGDVAYNVVENGITPVESGGQPNPSRATNPYSSAYGATQVTNATQRDSGFPMPEFPKNGSAAEQKAWSATLYNHYLRAFGGDVNKATQAWHDGFGAAKEGRPDTTGYVDKVNKAMGGIRGPTLQQQEQTKADINLNTERAKADIQNQQKIAQELPEKQKGIEMFDKLLGSLEESYKRLDELGAINNPDKGVMANLQAGFSSSEAGQFIGGKSGAEAQSIRNKIYSARPILSQAIMKATGMSAKQLDSNVELQNFLKSATDPKTDFKSVMAQIELLRNVYANQKPNAAPVPQNDGWIIEEE